MKNEEDMNETTGSFRESERERTASSGKLEDLFERPPARYRGIPFWSWNSKLENAEVARQIRDLHAHGMGGFFIHSREGLETPYLGPDWMSSVGEAVRTAKELGMGAWLYDEDRWPSGAAGGIVTAASEEYASKALVLDTANTPDELVSKTGSGRLLYSFRARLDGDAVMEAVPVPLPDTGGFSSIGERADARLLSGERYLLFRRRVASPIPWYNGAPPPDNLNPATTDRFIDVTYRAYADAVGSEFGSTIPGIFTDEPNVSHGHFDLGESGWVPWTDALPRFFAERRGYDIRETLPWLFFEGNRSSKSRHDFWLTIGELFLRSYTVRIHDWCLEHGLSFTGHFLAEGDLGMAVARGGFVMPHYVHMDIPGIDVLGSTTDDLLTVKQCTSVANQFGRQVITETYGGAGWDMTIEDQRRVGDWQFVLGVTMRCQHLSLYSLKGCRKRDFPPSFGAHNPSWKYNPAVEEYFSRLGAVLDEGRAERKILVLHPLSTVRSMTGALRGRGYEGIGIREANAFGAELSAFCALLLGQHFDFDFGDETILEEYGKAEAGKLRVGQASYPVVLIPPGTKNLSGTVLPLLEAFTASGGRLVAFEPVPYMTDGAYPPPSSDAARRLKNLFSGDGALKPESAGEMFRMLGNLLPALVRITDEAGQEEQSVLCMTRLLPDRRIVFLVNTDRHEGKVVRLTIPGSFSAEEWDPLTGNRTPLVVERFHGNSTMAGLHPGPGDSMLLVLRNDGSDGCIRITGDFPTSSDSPFSNGRTRRRLASGTASGPSNVPSASPGIPTVYPGPAFAFRRTDPNVLVLDECSWKLSDTGEPYSRRMPVWKAQDELRKRLGMRSVARNSAEQRYAWLGKSAGKTADAEFRFEFLVENLPSSPVRLVVERQHGVTLILNGVANEPRPDGTYLDESFLTYGLEGMKQGLNVLTVRLPYDEEAEFENCYLLGDFAVSRDGRIVREPACLYPGDWCLQGYPQYAGGLIYEFSYVPEYPGSRTFLTIEDFRAAAVDVRVNGESAGFVLWKSRPTVELTDLLSPAANSIELELTGSLRNMLGPLRRAGDAPPVTGWPSFITEGTTYAAHPVLVPYGLFRPVKMEELP